LSRPPEGPSPADGAREDQPRSSDILWENAANSSRETSKSSRFARSSGFPDALAPTRRRIQRGRKRADRRDDSSRPQALTVRARSLTLRSASKTSVTSRARSAPSRERPPESREPAAPALDLVGEVTLVGGSCARSGVLFASDVFTGDDAEIIAVLHPLINWFRVATWGCVRPAASSRSACRPK
jgi:hypothetical protein